MIAQSSGQAQSCFWCMRTKHTSEHTWKQAIPLPLVLSSWASLRMTMLTHAKQKVLTRADVRLTTWSHSHSASHPSLVKLGEQCMSHCTRHQQGKTRQIAVIISNQGALQSKKAHLANMNVHHSEHLATQHSTKGGRVNLHVYKHIARSMSEVASDRCECNNSRQHLNNMTSVTRSRIWLTALPPCPTRIQQRNLSSRSTTLIGFHSQMTSAGACTVGSVSLVETPCQRQF